MMERIIVCFLILLTQSVIMFASSKSQPHSDKVNLSEATERLKNLHKSFKDRPLIESQGRNVPNLLRKTTPEYIRSPSTLNQEVNEMLIEYVMSFMNVTSDLLNLNNIQVWNEIMSQELTPTSLLRDVDNVLNYVVQHLPLVDANEGHSVQSLSYKSSEIEVSSAKIVRKDGVVTVKSDSHLSRNRRKQNLLTKRSLNSDAYTVVTITYKTLPTVIEETLSSIPGSNRALRNSSKSFFYYSGSGLCQDLDYSLTDSLCLLKDDKLIQKSFRRLKSKPKLTWSFLPKSSVRSITAYHHATKEKMSVPVRFKIETFPSALNHEQSSLDSDQLRSHACVFYNTTINKWSDDGCRLVSKDGDSFTCFCNHTTNFALLVLVPIDFDGQTRSPNECDFIMEVVSYFANGMSVTFLTISVAFFAFTKSGSQRIAERNMVHFYLALSMLLLQAALLADNIFTFALSRAGVLKPTWLCTAIAFLTHFFLLCNFSWMTVEGILLYRYVVDGNLRKKLLGKWKFVIGWALPAAIAGVTLIVGMSMGEPYLQLPPNSTLTKLEYKYNSSQFVCYLSRDLVWAAFVPMMTSVTINIIITVLVTRVIARLTRESASFKPSTDVPYASQMNIKVLKKSLVAFCKLYPTLGILWMLSIAVALMQHTNVYCILQIGHLCLNGMQGVFLFLITIMQSEENRSVLKSKVATLQKNTHCLVDYFRTRSGISFPFSSAENRTSATDLRSDKSTENKNTTNIFLD